MTKKQILRVIAFCLLAALMMVFLCDLFETENTKGYDKRFYTYRTYNENTVDAVFIGTSGADRYWCAPKAYEDYGMTVYPLSTDAMPAWLYVNVLEYAVTYQNPELVLIDPRAFCQINETEAMDIRARRVLDAMAWGSPIWFESAFKTMEKVRQVDPEASRFDISYLLSFIRYHNKWADEAYTFDGNIGNRLHDYNGFFVSSALSPKQNPRTPSVYDASLTLELDPLSEAALYEVLDYCRSRNLEVLFVDTPQVFGNEEIRRMNRVYEILAEEGVPCLSFYTEDAGGKLSIDLDFDTDYYNNGHVNFYGAVKFTDVLAAYLDANYDLPDRRSDPAAQENWDGVYDALTAQMEIWAANLAAAGPAETDEPIPDEE